MRIGVSRVVVVLKWGAIVWLALGVLAFVIGLANKPMPELFVTEGLLFGLPGLFGLVLAYIVAGFGVPDVPRQHQPKRPIVANEGDGGSYDAIPSGARDSQVLVPTTSPPELPASQDIVRKRKVGRFLAYGISLPVILGVFILRGEARGSDVTGKMFVALFLMELVMHFLPRLMAPELPRNAYVVVGTLMALVAIGLGFRGI